MHSRNLQEARIHFTWSHQIEISGAAGSGWALPQSPEVAFLMICTTQAGESKQRPARLVSIILFKMTVLHQGQGMSISVNIQSAPLWLVCDFNTSGRVSGVIRMENRTQHQKDDKQQTSFRTWRNTDAADERKENKSKLTWLGLWAVSPAVKQQSIDNVQNNPLRPEN